MRKIYIPHFGALLPLGAMALFLFNLKPMAKKALDTAIARNCTLLTSVQSATKIATHQPSVECLVITFTDGLQVEYLCPTDAEYYLQVVEHDTQSVCLVLYPECKPAKLTFTAQE